MKIQFEKSEAEEYFHNALCNGLGELSSYGSFGYSPVEYKMARMELARKRVLEGKSDPVCYEDVLMEMLRMGFKLSFTDEGGDDRYEITLNEVHERMPLVPLDHMMDMINEQDDATTANVILQTVFLGEIVYG